MAGKCCDNDQTRTRLHPHLAEVALTHLAHLKIRVAAWPTAMKLRFLLNPIRAQLEEKNADREMQQLGHWLLHQSAKGDARLTCLCSLVGFDFESELAVTPWRPRILYEVF